MLQSWIRSWRFFFPLRCLLEVFLPFAWIIRFPVRLRPRRRLKAETVSFTNGLHVCFRHSRGARFSPMEDFLVFFLFLLWFSSGDECGQARSLAQAPSHQPHFHRVSRLWQPAASQGGRGGGCRHHTCEHQSVMKEKAKVPESNLWLNVLIKSRFNPYETCYLFLDQLMLNLLQIRQVKDTVVDLSLSFLHHMLDDASLSKWINIKINL